MTVLLPITFELVVKCLEINILHQMIYVFGKWLQSEIEYVQQASQLGLYLPSWCLFFPNYQNTLHYLFDIFEWVTLLEKTGHGLGNTSLWTCSTALKPILSDEDWSGSAMQCEGQLHLCGANHIQPYLNASSVLPCSFPFIHTNSHILYNTCPCLGPFRPSGRKAGGGSCLTPGELAVGMTSPWPHCSPTQPIPTVLRNSSKSG